MKKFTKWFHKRAAAYTIASCSAVVLYLALTHINVLTRSLNAFFSFTSPVVYGLIIAYVMDPLARYFERTLLNNVDPKFARKPAVTLSVLAVVIVMVLLAVALIPQLAKSIIGFVNNLDGYAVSFNSFINQLNKTFTSDTIDVSQITAIGSQMIQKISDKLPDTANHLVNTSFSVGTGFFNGVIAFILAIYFMMDKERLLRSANGILHAILPPQRYQKTTKFLKRCNSIIIRFILCDLLDGLIIGVANLIFMLALQMPYAALLSVVVGVTNLAPTFGPILGGLIGGLILLLVNPWFALWFLIFTLVLQTLDGYVIKPKLFGNLLGVSSLWILISIIVGGRMFGLIGIMLAIPFAAIVDFIFRDYYLPWRNRKKDEKSQSELLHKDSQIILTDTTIPSPNEQSKENPDESKKDS